MKGSKKCATGVKKMVIKKYQGGSSKVKVTKVSTEPTDVSLLKQSVDLHRSVKNNKNTPTSKPMFSEAVRTIEQKAITKDSTELAKKGYPKYAKGSNGIFSKKRQEESELDAIATDAGDEILSQVETPNTIKKMEFKAEPKPISIPETVEPIAITKTTPTSTTGLAKGGDAKLAAWQSKRGLKADGVWGKESKTAYDAEQKSKKMKIGKNAAITKTNTSPSEFKNTDYSAEVKSNPAYKSVSVSRTSPQGKSTSKTFVNSNDSISNPKLLKKPTTVSRDKYTTKAGTTAGDKKTAAKYDVGFFGVTKKGKK